MSTKTYTANVDLFLIDGEIFITEPHDEGEEKTIYSTKKIHDCPLLDRNRFVKGEDLDDFIAEAYHNTKGHKGQVEGFELGFKAGYQANKAEFTREELEKAFMAGIKSVTAHGVWYKIFNEFVSELRQLSLPDSVTIENNEIIEVKWK